MASSNRAYGSGRRYLGPLDDLSRETWGWNERKTFWVPPQFAGEGVGDVNILRGWTPNPCQVPLIEDRCRNKHAVVNRRGGKTNGMGACASDTSYRRAEQLIRGEDPHPEWTPAHFDKWFRTVVGEPGKPERINSSRLLRRTVWPIPCVGAAPEASLCDLQRVELASHFDQWEDELGVTWLDGESTLVVLALGIIWRFITLERSETKVGTGNVVLWITEAARCKKAVWEHVLPSLADREGSLLTDTTPWGGRDPDGYWGQCVISANDEEAALHNTKPDPPHVSRYYHWEPIDNFAVPNLVNEMRRDVAKYGANSAYVLRTWKGSWATPEGACWPEFSRQSHVCWKDPTEYDLWIGGYDHGFGSHPLCCLVLGLTRNSPRKVHIFAALYGVGIWVVPPDEGVKFLRSNTVMGFLMRQRERIMEKVGDAFRLQGYGAPERPESWQALNKIDRMNWVIARHVSVGGIENVGSLFASDRLTLNPDLPKEVYRDIEGARWAQDTGKRDLPTFDKKVLDPHAGEALVYAVQGVENVLDFSAFKGSGWKR